MTDDEHLAVEVGHYLQRVHDLADLLAERMGGLPSAEAEALLDQILAQIAVGAKQLEAANSTPEIASRLGFKVSAVIRTRVEELLRQR